MCSLSHPTYIRDKARQMRLEKDLTIDEIAERLAISRQTIFHWVRDIPMRRPRRIDYASRAEANRLRYQQLRDAAYEQGQQEFDELAGDPTFRDLSVCTSARAASGIETLLRSATRTRA
jgi:transcriptional regulator with XRE-family HTH domain